MIKSPLNIMVVCALIYFIITFLIWPNVTMFMQVFLPDGEWTLDVFEKLVSSERAMKSLRNSFLLAISLAITVNLIGIFIVLVTRFFDIKGSKILYVGFATNLIYGGVILVSGYNLIYGPNGFLTNVMLRFFPEMDVNWFRGMPAVVLLMTFSGTGSHLLFIGNSISTIDQQTIDAAKQMGASTWKILMTVVLPVIKPMIFATSVLVFLGGLSAMTAPLILGGDDFQTISSMILTFSRTKSSQDLAATLAMILGVATLLVLMILNKVEKEGTYFSVSKVPLSLEKQKIENPAANTIVHLTAWSLWMVYIIPPILIVLFSFTNASAIASGTISLSDLTVSNYIQVFTSKGAIKPFMVSIIYSAVCTLLVVLALFFVARIIQRHRNWVTVSLEYLLHIPWVLPGTLIALGLLITFSEPQVLIAGKVLSGTVYILTIGYIVEKIPFTFRILKAAFSGIPANVEEAASILGASDLRVFRKILFPLVIPVATAIAALNFNSLLGNYDTAIFLAHPFYQPLGIFIYNATSTDTLNDTTVLTFVYSVLLMIISSIVLYFVYGRSSNDVTKK